MKAEPTGYYSLRALLLAIITQFCAFDLASNFLLDCFGGFLYTLLAARPPSLARSLCPLLLPHARSGRVSRSIESVSTLLSLAAWLDCEARRERAARISGHRF